MSCDRSCFELRECGGTNLGRNLDETQVGPFLCSIFPVTRAVQGSGLLVTATKKEAATARWPALSQKSN